MGKILLTGDLHANEGIMAEVSVQYLEYIFNYALDNNISTIIFNGDIFEKSSKIKNEAFVPIFMKLMEYHKKINLIFELGNHDIYNLDNDSIVETFQPFGKVVKEYEQITLFDKSIDLLSYTKDPDMIPEKGNVLITHLSIADFQFDNKYHVNEKNAFPTDLFKEYDIVFSGHFHRHQHKKNIVYIGAPYQLNYGDGGVNKGFIVLETDDNSWEFVVYDEAPKYKKIHIKDFDKTDVNNCFVKVFIDGKLDDYVKLKHLLYEKGAIEVLPDYKEEEETINENTEVELNQEIKDMMVEYIKGIEIENIDTDLLVTIFQNRILGEM